MLKRTKTAVTLAIASALWACTPEPAELYEDAQAAFDVADFKAARVSLLSALEGDPGNVDMQVLLARTLVALGNGEGAALRLSQLTEAKRQEPEIVLLIAEAALLRGQFDEALAAVDGREDAAADRVRGLAYIGQDKLAEAAKAFEAGVKRETPNARLFSSYARFELARDNTGRALELAEKALETDPALAEVFLTRGAVLVRRNELSKALADYDAALKKQPANFDARLGRALVLAKMGKSVEALQLATALQEEDPNSPDVAIVRAQVAANDKDWQKVRDILQRHETALRGNTEALTLYSEALIALDVPGYALNYLLPELERRPASRTLRRLVAKAQLAAGESDNALATIGALANRPDASEDELTIAADAARATGNTERASSFTKRSATATPEWIGGELAKADRALRNRQWAAAERSYEAILDRTGGKNAIVLNNLAYAQEQQGKKEAALENALEAVKLDPENASILDTAGWLLVQTGSKERGITMLSKAAKIDPANKTVARHLEEARAL